MKVEITKDWCARMAELEGDSEIGAGALPLTDAEDLLLEIANSMSKDFADPVEHANWCVEEAQKYFVKRTLIADQREKS